jgi:hypothetical protein
MIIMYFLFVVFVYFLLLIFILSYLMYNFFSEVHVKVMVNDFVEEDVRKKYSLII